MKMPETIPDNLLAPCGINCMLCHHHCESSEPCQGCRDGKGKSRHCQECELLKCVESKGVRYCMECEEFPCIQLGAFNEMYQNRFGHTFLPNASFMRYNGKEALIQKLLKEWSCPDCGGVICIHDDCCSECKKKIVFAENKNSEESIRPVVKTERLKLVPFHEKYASDLFELWGDYEVIKYTYMSAADSESECRSRIARFIKYTREDFTNNLVIMLGKKAVGIIGSPIISVEKESFGLYYQLARKYWGNGYVSEAAKAYLSYLTPHFSHAVINAAAVSVNPGSVAILKKLGFQETKLEKDGFDCNQLKLDLLHFTYNTNEKRRH